MTSNNNASYGCEADIQHAIKYAGDLSSPDPARLVRRGEEPPSYLLRFGPNSIYHQECRNLIENITENVKACLGSNWRLAIFSVKTEADMNYNVLLAKVAREASWLKQLEPLSIKARTAVICRHLKKSVSNIS